MRERAMSLSEKDLESIKGLLFDPIMGSIGDIKKNIEEIFFKIDSLMKIEKDMVILRKDCEYCKLDVQKKFDLLFKRYDEHKAEHEKQDTAIENEQETLEKKIEDSKYAAFKQAFKMILNTAAVIGALTVIGGFAYGVIKLLILLGIIK